MQEPKTNWFRIIIDSLVIIMAVFWLAPTIGYYILPPVYDGIIYDDATVTLDERIAAVMAEAPRDFMEKLENPSKEGSFDFRTLAPTERTALTPSDNYRTNVPGTVYITTEDEWGDTYIGSGSVLTSDGLILTNYHVVEGSEAVVVATHDEALYTVREVVAVREEFDIAVLKIDAFDLTSLPVGTADPTVVSVGDPVFTIGHPESFLYSFADGVISGIRDYTEQGGAVELQITNPTSRGNSGGALLNEYGELIGVPYSGFEYEDNSVQVQNINFAIPIDAVLELLK